MAEAYEDCECALESKEGKCICHFPIDALRTIMRHLSILDYIKCRAVSKCWSSAFSVSSKNTYLSQARRCQPWFLVLDTNDSLEHTGFFRATSKLGTIADQGIIYDTNMSELHGTYVLLSQYGWMLLYSSRSLFFFHMFSRTRIDIPYVNVAEMWDPIFEITAPPTSPDCILFSVASYKTSSPYMDCQVKYWSNKDLSWNPVWFKSIVFESSDFMFGVDDKQYCVNANGGYNVIDVANSNRKEGSRRSRKKKDSLKAVLVECPRLSRPQA